MMNMMAAGGFFGGMPFGGQSRNASQNTEDNTRENNYRQPIFIQQVIFGGAPVPTVIIVTPNGPT